MHKPLSIRFRGILVIVSAFILLFSCGPDYKKFVPPPPQPVSYSGAAADPDWVARQTETYKNQGAPEAQAELTARMEYEREASGQKGSFSPVVSEVIMEQKPKKGDKDQDGDKTALNPSPIPIASHTPHPSATPPPSPTPQIIMSSGPAVVPQENTPIVPPTVVPTVMPGVPQHPGE